ncbi:MAG: hypothetical protein JGK24_28955 [Microcoleus sp. PH2017_29_MFU_D_A]|uniref:hypothetical protein n=1 Tax=unclassified Microcoleus TaxID=2642155 RepID=UPI001E07C3C3|nr:MULTISPECIES: hypothetical protein [unclassified Microcoleus]MCC3433445.1 hypothetical protein [Microcoleus sp. PH2017_04_SCI_O_A]MCC3443139.1 hypothetical protein [Microcoleus sp. PH2017_03_ELD_O_A]MCC3467462.1 hypothetical protein [Microcoleus sp. PH2017_06_SFM_O_A]MCC3505541.1 hypothetical protein [Microcoleus sp. PH2017_19_SFW_U_A]MCC3511073.1 hypothetical protein [Microcoleus sp. PH2017_17_BER_D_A]TAE08536.1 MAG: hypothetical protein EAZ94_24975 [Oscillatoriales cyanobacterium]TAE882
MTTPPNPLTPTPTPSQSSPTPVVPSPPVSTKLGTFTQKLVMNVLEVVDQVLYGLMGQLGRTVFGSIQDAIAIGILLKLPGLIGEIIIGKDFSGFDICLKESPWGVSRYACFIIVASDFLLWIVLAGRIIGRFWADLKDLKNNP